MTSVLRFGPAVADLGYLVSTAELPWDSFWIQGGAIEAGPVLGQYEISQITIGREACLWIGAESCDYGVRDEAFIIAVGRDENRGDPDYESRWRPRRESLETFPADLPLDQFGPLGRSYELVRTGHTDSTGRRVEIESGLIVINRSGDRLLFYADQLTPLDMYVTMNEGLIRAYCSDALAIRALSSREA